MWRTKPGHVSGVVTESGTGGSTGSRTHPRGISGTQVETGSSTGNASSAVTGGSGSPAARSIAARGRTAATTDAWILWWVASTAKLAAARVVNQGNVRQGSGVHGQPARPPLARLARFKVSSILTGRCGATSARGQPLARRYDRSLRRRSEERRVGEEGRS